MTEKPVLPRDVGHMEIASEYQLENLQIISGHIVHIISIKC